MLRIKKIIFNIGFLFLLLSVMLCPADFLEAKEIDLIELSLEELMDIKIVSASKKSQKSSEVAASAFVISHEDIRRYGYRTLGESLRRISGLYLSSGRDYDYLGVRGFSLAGDYNTKILILIDGHRVNDALYDQAYIENAFPIDMESIERIEVVKGPGSALWGSNALFAVVNVITRKGKDIDGGKITAETGSHNRQKGYLEYGRVFDNGLNIAGSFSRFDSDGENHIYFPERDQPGYQFNNGVARGNDDEDAYKGYVTFSYNDWGFLFYKSKRSKTVPTGSWDGAFNYGGNNVNDENTSFELNYNTALFPGKNGRLELRFYHDSHEYYGDYPWFEDGGWSGTIINNKDEGNSKHWGTEIRYNVDITEKLAVTAGFEYMDIYESHQKSWDDSPDGYEWLYLDTGTDKNTFHTLAYYVHGEYALLDKLTLVGGIRLDDYSTLDRQWSPRAALLYSPFESTTLKLLYGEAFRAPNNYEMFYDDGSSQIGNEELKPEEINTWELVWEQKIATHTRLVASLYRFEIKDLILQDESNILQFLNTPMVRSDGGEIQLNSHFKNGITSYLGVGAINTRYYDADVRLDNSPALNVSGGISIPIWSKKLYLSPEFIYVADRKSSLIGQDTESYFLTNLGITTGTLFDKVDISFNIYNLFNERIDVPAGGEHYFYDSIADDYTYFDIPQDGRTFRFQLSYRF
ncbi:MAG: TonB-dependent receptor [Desulfobacula sp.]|nr:TonB-dependent receptor [Desulfobacula sp.]